MHLEVSRVVKADLETVFAAYTNFEAMPKWSKRLSVVKVTGRDGNVVHLESETVSSERARRRIVGRVVLRSPSSVESDSETRFTRTKRTVAFERTAEGWTRLTATLDMQVKGLWSLVLSPRMRKEDAESSAIEELASFARFVELPPDSGSPAPG